MPEAERVGFALVRELARGVRTGGVMVLTGAGVSTDSGIADYRDASGRWKHRKPIEIGPFRSSEAVRRRYWARSLLGYTRLAQASPNAGHRALAALERAGLVSLLVTQNVDGLHQKAGSSRVVDLHGRMDRVVCLHCGWQCPRPELQVRLAMQNPQWLSRRVAERPDGDAEITDADYGDFVVFDCPACGGVLKPDVVFFGERVPPDRVARAQAGLAAARMLLIVGSSLMVFSGYRFAWAAEQRGVPVAIINQGVTRADRSCAIKLDGNAAAVLIALCRELGIPPSGGS